MASGLRSRARTVVASLVPDGHFNGSSYNGSPGAAEWEAGLRQQPNPGRLHSTRPISSQPDALPLYMGFLTEIQARGYVLPMAAGAYSFRCTASTRKDCRGLTRDSLSNHAYGLAADINPSAEPDEDATTGSTARARAKRRSDRHAPMGDPSRREVGPVLGWLRMERRVLSRQTNSRRRRVATRCTSSSTAASSRHGRFCATTSGTRRSSKSIDENGNVEERCFGPNMPPAGTRMVIHTDAPTGATAAL